MLSTLECVAYDGGLSIEKGVRREVDVGFKDTIWIIIKRSYAFFD